MGLSKTLNYRGHVLGRIRYDSLSKSVKYPGPEILIIRYIYLSHASSPTMSQQMTRYEKKLLNDIISRVAQLSRNGHIFGILHMPPGGSHAYYGHEFMEQTLRAHENTFLRHEDFIPEATSATPARLPFDLCRMDIGDLRSHCSLLVRYGFAKLGRSKPKYKGEPRPSFWPVNIHWRNPSSGISKEDLMSVIDHLHTHFDSDATGSGNPVGGNPPPSPPRQVTPAHSPPAHSPPAPSPPAPSPSLPSSSPASIWRRRTFTPPPVSEHLNHDSSDSSNMSIHSEITGRRTRRRFTRMLSDSSSSSHSPLHQSPGSSTRTSNSNISRASSFNNDFSPIPLPPVPSLVKRNRIARRRSSDHLRPFNEHSRLPTGSNNIHLSIAGRSSSSGHSVSAALRRYRHPEQLPSNMNCIESNESSSIQVLSTPNDHQSTAGTSAPAIPGTWHTPQISSNIDPRTRDIVIRSGPKSKRGRRQKHPNRFTPSNY